MVGVGDRGPRAGLGGVGETGSDTAAQRRLVCQRRREGRRRGSQGTFTGKTSGPGATPRAETDVCVD